MPDSTIVLGIAAYSGTGKTTLLEQLIPLLKQQGLRIALIKHAHHDFDIDHEGKDSYRLRKAGAQQTIVASTQRWALINENQTQQTEPQLDDLLKQLNHDELDLVLVEGFKHENIERIELHRPSLQKPLLYINDPRIIAIASDELITDDMGIPLLDINQPRQIADFIIHTFLPTRTEKP
jgi:molybdopterin-guanine dinucleotide biosynthesis protein B